MGVRLTPRRLVKKHEREMLRRLVSSLPARALQTRAYAEAAPTGKLSLTFVSPRKTFFQNEAVDLVDVPGLGGDFGIAPNHAPMIAMLTPGVVTVNAGNQATKVFVSAGSITINADSSCQIIAAEAHPVDALDKSLATSGLDQAKRDAAAAKDDSEKVLAETRVETFEAIIKAL